MSRTKHPRTPINVPLKHGYLTHREAIWAAIRSFDGLFTNNDIQQKTGCNKDTVQSYLTGLINGDYLERHGREPYQPKPGCAPAPTAFRPYRYLLVKDVGVEAPRVNKHGEEVYQGRGREQLWRTMRILGEFCIQDLAVHASTENVQVKFEEAKTYVSFLKSAGYLVISQPRSKGRSTRYRFVPGRYSGPKPPMIQNIKQVFDPNLGIVVWTQGGDQ